MSLLLTLEHISLFSSIFIVDLENVYVCRRALSFLSNITQSLKMRFCFSSHLSQIDNILNKER